MEALQKISKKLYQSYKEKILDIIVFGSSVRGKMSPRDVDVAILIKDTGEHELSALRAEFEKMFTVPAHLNLYRMEDIFFSDALKPFLEEGISLRDMKPVHQKIGFESGSIFSVEVKHLQKSKKVLFSYALHGKKNLEGILHKVKGKTIGRAVFYIPAGHTDEFKEFLELWKAEFFMMKVLKD